MILWPVILVYVCLINLVTFHVWALDKKYAIARQRRVPESTLLTLCAVGGWPMGMIGTHVFRHKSSKKAFIHKVYVVVAFQVALLCSIIVLM
jgi:uncharacterized membrane protein YsdA (DUF1294 family)